MRKDPPPLSYATPKPTPRPPMHRIVGSLFSGTFLIALGLLLAFATIRTARASLAAFGGVGLLAMIVMLTVAAILLLGGGFALRTAISGLRSPPRRE